MTAFDGRLFARMGSPITVRPQQPSSASGSSSLVCLDLEAEGKLLWRVVADEGWAFEGSPVVDGSGVYAAMRRSDARPQAHVACFDPQTGRLRWRRFVCAAESPARGLLPQCTHNLLTLRGETLYYNTNLGAVAALSDAAGASALGQPVSPRAARRSAPAGGPLAARPDAVPLSPRHALRGPGRRAGRSSPSTPGPAKCCGASNWKTRPTCWASAATA